MDIKDIEHIIKILKQNEVTDFELEQDGTRIRLARTPNREYISELPIEMKPAIQGIITPISSHTTPSADADAGRYVQVTSPIVGTFYRRPSPDAELFVKEGDSVRKGDTLCIVEAMKLMNEIEAETDGRIVRILGDDGQVVEYGEVLFLIDPS